MLDNDTMRERVQQTQNPVKIKIEFKDNTGTKYSFNVEGTSKDNVAKLIDFAQSISSNINGFSPEEPLDTNMNRIYGLVKTNFKFGSFNSNDIKQAYEHDFQIPIGLSIVSTYLSRLARRSLLFRTRSGAGWMYRLPQFDRIDTTSKANGVAMGQITP